MTMNTSYMCKYDKHAQLQYLKDNNYKLIYTDWQSGSENSKINFIQPTSLCKVLLELKC